MFSRIVSLSNACSTECVGFYEICSCLQICLNDQMSCSKSQLLIGTTVSLGLPVLKHKRSRVVLPSSFQTNATARMNVHLIHKNCLQYLLCITKKFAIFRQ